MSLVLNHFLYSIVLHLVPIMGPKVTGFLASKPSSVPFDQNAKLASNEGQPLEDPSSYRRLNGRLIYLTNSRPDISYGVQHLTQYVSRPLLPHYQAATSILRYSKVVPDKGILFYASSSLKMFYFADSDWVKCPDIRKFVTGYRVILGSSLLWYKSKKQHIVSRFSTETEYCALAFLTCKLQWLQYLFHDFLIAFPQPTSVYYDSKFAIYLAHNPKFHERSKHIELNCHMVNEKLQIKLIHLLHVSSSAKLADMFTKPLHSPSLNFILVKLGLCSLNSPTWERLLSYIYKPIMYCHMYI